MHERFLRSIGGPFGTLVLVVDDHRDTLDALSTLVEMLGGTPVAASSGGEALARAHATKPDLILCDIQMPVLDGYQFLEALRHDAALHDVPVLAVTGWADPQEVRRAREAGFDGHLPKPIELRRVEAIVARMLETGRILVREGASRTA